MTGKRHTKYPLQLEALSAGLLQESLCHMITTRLFQVPKGPKLQSICTLRSLLAHTSQIPSDLVHVETRRLTNNVFFPFLLVDVLIDISTLT